MGSAGQPVNWATEGLRLLRTQGPVRRHLMARTEGPRLPTRPSCPLLTDGGKDQGGGDLGGGAPNVGGLVTQHLRGRVRGMRGLRCCQGQVRVCSCCCTWATNN